MKRCIRLVLLGIFVASATPIAAQDSFQDKSTTAAAVPGVSINRDFELVTSKLDKGGTLYVYLDIEGALEGLITRFEPFFAASRDPFAQQLPGIGRKVIKTVGFDQLSDIGISLVRLDNGMRRMKVYVHVKKSAGLLQMGGGIPGKLDGISYVPEDASIGYAANITLDRLPELVEQIGHDIKGSEGREAVQGFFDKVRAEIGTDARALMATTGNEWAGWLRLDPTKTVPLGPMTVPEAGALFMIKVKDRSLFDILKQQIEKTGNPKTSQLENISGVEASLVLEVPDNPFAFRPILAQIEGWLIVASSSRELERSQETRKSGKDMRQSTVYRKLAAGLPEQVNSVFFVHPDVGRETARLLQQVSSASGVGKEAMIWSRDLQNFSKFAGYLGVRLNDETGYLDIAQGELHATQAFQSMTAGGATAILAAIAVPNFLQAQTRAKVSRVRSDMRSMATGLEAYFIDYNKYPPSSAAKGKSMVKAGDGQPISSFVGGHLTTPITYLRSYISDPFSSPSDQTFGYYNPGNADKDVGWILFSPGPDTKYDLGWDVYDPKVKQPSEALLTGYTYDPTNGTVSSGDVWRVKQ